MSDVINRFNVGFNERKSSIPVLFESGNARGGGHGDGDGDGNYNNLQQKPKINNIELVGNKTGTDLGLADATLINVVLSIITGVEQTMVATKAYVEHDLVIVGNNLYVITSPVGSGSQLVIGTNCKQTTISEQITSGSGHAAILG